MRRREPQTPHNTCRPPRLKPLTPLLPQNRPFSARKGVTGYMHPPPSNRKGVAGYIRGRIRASGSRQGTQMLMPAASVTILVASEHEQRAFPRPSEADRQRPGGVVAAARPSSFLARRPHDSSPRGVDLAARDLWKLTAITIVVNAILAVSAYWVFSFIRIGPLQLLFIWFPLCLCAALPHLVEMSVRPF